MFHPNHIFHTTVLATAVFLFGGRASADDVCLRFQEVKGSYDIAGSFWVQAEPGTVWDVLTDYEHIPKFVGNLKKSHVQEDIGPYHFRLEQEFEGGILFITKRVRVVLDVHEEWYKSIVFTDIHGKDFEFYRGSWRLETDPAGGLNIHYQLKAKQNFEVPFAGDFMKGGVKDLLEAVRREILRRQARVEKEGSHG